MKDLTQGNIRRTFFLFAFPMVLAGLLAQAHNLIDTVIAGHYLGDKGLAAIGSTAALITFFSSIFWGYSNGFSIYIARLFGKKDFASIKQALIAHFTLLIVVMLTVFSLLFVLRRPVYAFLQIDPAVYEDADKYFSIAVFGCITTVLSLNGLYLLNAFGESLFPFLMSLLGSALNIGGNLLTVKRFGVVGLASATVCASLTVTICYFVKIVFCLKKMGVWGQKTKFNLSCLRCTLPYSVPTMMQQSVMYLASMALSPLVNGISAAATASYTVVLRIYNITAETYQYANKTIASYTAQCLGAEKRGQIRKGLGICLFQSLLFVLPLVLLCVLIPNEICSIFFNKGYDGETLVYSITFLRCFLPLIYCNLVANLFHNFFRGMGEMKALFAATCCGSLARIVFSFLLTPFFGIYGVFAGWALSWIADGLFGYLLYRFKYRKQLR